MLPSKYAEPDRYKSRPLLWVLEHYVLAAIGELDPQRNQEVAKIVKSVFGGDDDWMRAVKEELHLGDSMDGAMQKLWQRNQDIASQNGVELHPVQFAKMFVDKNFADLIDSRQ